MDDATAKVRFEVFSDFSGSRGPLPTPSQCDVWKQLKVPQFDKGYIRQI
jgi:hypothetical protein